MSVHILLCPLSVPPRSRNCDCRQPLWLGKFANLRYPWVSLCSCSFAVRTSGPPSRDKLHHMLRNVGQVWFPPEDSFDQRNKTGFHQKKKRGWKNAPLRETRNSAKDGGLSHKSIYLFLSLFPCLSFPPANFFVFGRELYSFISEPSAATFHSFFHSKSYLLIYNFIHFTSLFIHFTFSSGRYFQLFL